MFERGLPAYHVLVNTGIRRVYRVAFLTGVCLAIILAGATGCSPTESGRVGGQSDSVLHLSDAGPVTLDPAISGDMSSHRYVKHMYSGLVRLNSDLAVEPDIAEDWAVSDDGTTYTFYLREDVRFHSGDPVTAADFKYSWERACSPSTGSSTAPTYLGDIVGASEIMAGEAEELSGVTVVDDYTLRVEIDLPRAYFIDKLTYPTTFVVDEATVSSGQGWWREPNGTGPFELARWDEGSLLVLQRYGDYYGMAPSLEEVHFHLLAGLPMSLYEQGTIDVVNVSTSYMYQATDPANPFSEQLVSTPELSLYYIGFNVDEPPFDDPLVRRAFCHAVDRERIVSVLFNDSVTIAGGILPVGLPGHDPSLDPYPFDPQRARELLAESSYGSADALPPVVVTVSGYANSVTGYVAAAMRDWQEHLGVDITVRQLEPDIYLYELPEEKDGVFAMGWIADYPDPHNFLGTLLSSGEHMNISGYSNPEFDALLDRAAAETDEEERLRFYNQAERMVVEDAPCLPLLYGANHVLVKPYVTGFEPGPLGIADLTEVEVNRP